MIYMIKLINMKNPNNPLIQLILILTNNKLPN